MQGGGDAAATPVADSAYRDAGEGAELLEREQVLVVPLLRVWMGCRRWSSSTRSPLRCGPATVPGQASTRRFAVLVSVPPVANGRVSAPRLVDQVGGADVGDLFACCVEVSVGLDGRVSGLVEVVAGGADGQVGVGGLGHGRSGPALPHVDATAEVRALPLLAWCLPRRLGLYRRFLGARGECVDQERAADQCEGAVEVED